MCRAKLAEVGGGRLKKTAKGRPYYERRSAIAPMAPEAVRSEHSEPVRAAAIALLTIATHLRPGKKRAGDSAALYLGDPSGKRWCGIAAHARRSTRELERYLAVWRTHRVGFVAWQLPATAEGVKVSRTGHAYNVFEWADDELPRELVEHVSSWTKALEAEQRRNGRDAAKAPRSPHTPAPRQGATASAAAITAGFLAKLGLDPPS